ncbi:MAG: crossover junction endodeoxyribonuclease RuvC [Gammaproteobacteria bacterium]
MPLVLGIDPGSRQTGFGFLFVEAGAVAPRHVHSGVIRMSAPRLTQRLADIFTQLDRLIQELKPSEVAVEQVFMASNAASALKLGQARGAAIVAAVQYGLPVYEYSAKQVKQAVVGFGGADKHQMQLMMRHHLKLDRLPQSDEADALGVAWCHSQTRGSPLLSESSLISDCTTGRAEGDEAGGAVGFSKARSRRRGWRAYRPPT